MGLSSEAFIAGLQKALDDEQLAFSAAEEQEILNKFQTIQEAAKAQADQAVAMGADFLAKKAAEEGVQATGSGLLYKVVKQGDGPKPTKNDRVRVHYRGTLLTVPNSTAATTVVSQPPLASAASSRDGPKARS